MRKISFGLIAGASFLAFAAQAQAQDAAPQADDADNADAAVITVTGSRTIKNGDNSPSPVTVVSVEDMLKIQPGSTLAETLNSLPVFAGSRGGASNPTTVGSAAGGNGSANQLNLRNMGSTRTLVLMDGKRAAPSLFNGAVDVDIIPQMLIERVDIVTGGVSAVYGSDAVAGVVNYVINRKLQGFRADFSAGTSGYGDARKYDAAIAYGTSLGDRAHIEFSYEYRKEEGIDRRSDRPWMRQAGVTGAGTAASPFLLGVDLRQKGFPFGGLINTGVLAGQNFKENGVLSSFVNGTATGTAAVQIGGDGGFWDSGLLAKLKGHQLFGRFDYDFSDNVRGYVQVSGNIKNNTNLAETNQLNAVTISRTNAFLPAAITALIPTTQPTFTLSKFLGDAPRVSGISDSRQWVFSGGLIGKIGGFDWDIGYTHSASNLKTSLQNVINRQKLSAALDAVSSGSQIVCNVTITNPGLANDCIPLNVFGPTASSAAAIDYVTDTVLFNSRTVMDNIAGQVSGSLFDGWAGPITAALSAEWRKLSFTSTSGSRPTDLVNCTGLRFNCTAGTAVTEFVFGERTPVSQSVTEVALELDVPVFKDSAVGSLNVNGAARYTNYDTSGSYWTWKAGIDWHITDTLKFRATASRDIRAPNLFELFSPASSVTIRPTDLLTGLSPAVPSNDFSNPNLTAEIGKTITAGLVWKPSPKFSFALDGYRIRLGNAITQINGSTATFQTLCYASGGTSAYCALQSRPNGFTDTSAANAVTAWFTRNINLNTIETWGFDLEANYNATLFNRPMSLRFLSAWQPHLRYLQPGVPTIDQGGVAYGPLGFSATPSVRLAAFFRFQPAEHVTVDIMERWRNPMKLGGDPTQVWVENRIGSFATTNINLTYDFDADFGKASVYFNVQNLFDANPPVGGFSGNGTRAGLRDGFALGDDPRGRYFTAGVKLKF